MDDPKPSIALKASDVEPRARISSYPEPFATMMGGRSKRQLGDFFGLVNFGVNLTRLEPGAMSALRHTHSKQDEFIYVLAGCPTLITDEGTTILEPGMCAGFRAGSNNAHHLHNRSDQTVSFLEIGDRSAKDSATYPDDDIQAQLGVDGRWCFSHKDGSPY